MCMLGGVLSLKSLNILFVIELHIVLRFSRRAVFRGAAIYPNICISRRNGQINHIIEVKRPAVPPMYFRRSLKPKSMKEPFLFSCSDIR